MTNLRPEPLVRQLLQTSGERLVAIMRSGRAAGRCASILVSALLAELRRANNLSGPQLSRRRERVRLAKAMLGLGRSDPVRCC
jgi:hypothetical protein